MIKSPPNLWWINPGERHRLWERSTETRFYKKDQHSYLEHELVARDNPPRLVSELIERRQRIWTATCREMPEITEFVRQIQNPDARGWIAEVTEATAHILYYGSTVHRRLSKATPCVQIHIFHSDNVSHNNYTAKILLNLTVLDSSIPLDVWIKSMNRYQQFILDYTSGSIHNDGRISSRQGRKKN
jgi:hypothetical protein